MFLPLLSLVGPRFKEHKDEQDFDSGRLLLVPVFCILTAFGCRCKSVKSFTPVFHRLSDDNYIPLPVIGRLEPKLLTHRAFLSMRLPFIDTELNTAVPDAQVLSTLLVSPPPSLPLSLSSLLHLSPSLSCSPSLRLLLSFFFFLYLLSLGYIPRMLRVMFPITLFEFGLSIVSWLHIIWPLSRLSMVLVSCTDKAS